MTATGRFFEDFNVGDGFESETYTIDREASLAFAKAYDPQPFHLDEEAAAASLFGKLVCSGWQTTAITMRLLVDSLVLGGTGIIGTGIDELRWTAPVAPGDTLRLRAELVEKRAWPGNKPRGILRFRFETVNQDDIVVMTQCANCIVPKRGP
jgi:acyl dehydratase